METPTEVYKALVIDDEKPARDRLMRLLQPYQRKLQVVGEAADGEEGLEKVEALNPDVIFLDIQMPVLNGFEMLERLKVVPKVVFATAFDQYAIKAFEENSVDYLLKPIEEERLKRTIQKLDDLEHMALQRRFLQAIGKLHEEPAKTLAVTLGERILLVKTEDIVYLKAEDKYVYAYERNGKKHLLSQSLTELEHKLGPNFLRIHRATIINRHSISEIHKTVNGKLTFYMQGAGSPKLTTSQSYTPVVRKILEV